jgi:hypothetical protein
LHYRQSYRDGATERRGVREGIRSVGGRHLHFGSRSGTRRRGNDNVKGLRRRRSTGSLVSRVKINIEDSYMKKDLMALGQ